MTDRFEEGPRIEGGTLMPGDKEEESERIKRESDPLTVLRNDVAGLLREARFQARGVSSEYAKSLWQGRQLGFAQVLDLIDARL